MAFLTGIAEPIGKAARANRRRCWVMLVAAAAFFISAALLPGGPAHLALLAVGMTFLIVFVWILLTDLSSRAGAEGAHVPIGDLIGNDLAPSFLTGPDGVILYQNRAARDQLQSADAATLAAALQTTLVNPGALLFRLETRAAARGSAHEDVVVNKAHLRLSVHGAGEGRFLWRVERSAERPMREGGSTPVPMITLGRNDTILFMNPAARALIGERVRSLDRIFPYLPVRPGQVNEVSTQEGSVRCFISEIEGVAGRREVLLVPGVSGEGAADANPAEGDRKVDGLAFFEDLPVPLLKLSREGEIILSNRRARDLLGIAPGESRRFAELTEGLGRSISDWIADAAAGRGTIRPETLKVRGRDQDVFVQVTLNQAMHDGQSVLIAVLTDATKLKSLEEQFVQSQKMQAIGQLAGGVAHDFNNLLTAISGHCDLLLLRHDQGDPDYADLMQINQNANRAAGLVGQLLAYSRKQTLRPEVLDLRDTLSDLGHLLNRLVGEKVTLSLSHDPTLSHIRADKRQLEQVIMNLVVNARDAMSAGGTIRLETKRLEIDTPMKRGRAEVAPGKYVQVTVSDEGEGIPEDKLQKVFEPFFTTKRVGEGTGLGLSTTYGIVKQSGGFIFVESSVGVGTTFQILLPAHDLMAPCPKPASTPAISSGEAEGVVLLVEDEAPVRAFASRALQFRGFTVVEAGSAEDALELLSDPKLSVDVFVTDVVMPGRDGPSWVQEALKDRPEVKVVFMSGYAEETFSEAQSAIPNSVFLPKPFSLTELTDTVARQME